MSIVVLITSFFLMILNIIGLVRTHYKKIPEEFVNQIVFGRSRNLITSEDLSRSTHENEQDYCYRIFNTISKYIVHYQPKKHDSVPYTLNWILAFLKHSSLAYFKFYEFYNGARAIEKGYGLCSQFSIILWYYLRKARIYCYVIRLNGHVINEVHFQDGQIWTVDADYQTIIPLRVTSLHHNPSLICDYYTVSREKALILSNIYKQKSIQLKQTTMIARLFSENLLFVMKWFIPLLGFTISVYLYVQK